MTSGDTRFRYHLIAAGAATTLTGSDTVAGPTDPGLRSLVAQELYGRRAAETPSRVTELLDLYGFENEPWAEPGHLRRQPWAATMYDAAEGWAAGRAEDIAAALDLPFDRVSGASVVDSASPALAAYHSLIHQDASLYGPEPYRLAAPRADLMLRQTSCLQKFSVTAGWDLDCTPLPRCLFEVSNSFRGESETSLRRLYRVRHFRLPEAHLYARSVDELVTLASSLHPLLTDIMNTVATAHVVLVSVTSSFWSAYAGSLVDLLGATSTNALVVESAPGELCQDGIEVDFEYKFLDANGFTRELATFQLDRQLTAAIGLGLDQAPLSTMHLVPAGSVERLVFAHLDAVAAAEANGHRRRLPLWLSPVIVRVVLDADTDVSVSIARQMATAGLRTELDDRPWSTAAKLVDADRTLTPFVVSTSAATGPGQVQVREYESKTEATVDLADWLARMASDPQLSVVRNVTVPRLSAAPVARLRYEPRSKGPCA